MDEKPHLSIPNKIASSVSRRWSSCLLTIIVAVLIAIPAGYFLGDTDIPWSKPSLDRHRRISETERIRSELNLLTSTHSSNQQKKSALQSVHNLGYVISINKNGYRELKSPHGFSIASENPDGSWNEYLYIDRMFF